MAAVTARAGYMMGENVDRAWSTEHARAWEGFLELSRQLRREADGVLEPVEGLTVSMLGVMGRLARAHDVTLGEDAQHIEMARYTITTLPRDFW